MPDAVSSAELVGTHVKDQTGLGGPNSLKLLLLLLLLLLSLLLPVTAAEAVDREL